MEMDKMRKKLPKIRATLSAFATTLPKNPKGN
jgi:hypothetical protein